MYGILRKKIDDEYISCFVYLGFNTKEKAKNFIKKEIENIKEYYQLYDNTDEEFEKFKEDIKLKKIDDLDYDEIKNYNEKELKNMFEDEFAQCKTIENKDTIIFDIYDLKDIREEFRIFEYDCNSDKTIMEVL
jgi:hypothetical protein